MSYPRTLLRTLCLSLSLATVLSGCLQDSLPSGASEQNAATDACNFGERFRVDPSYRFIDRTSAVFGARTCRFERQGETVTVRIERLSMPCRPQQRCAANELRRLKGTRVRMSVAYYETQHMAVACTADGKEDQQLICVIMGPTKEVTVTGLPRGPGTDQGTLRSFIAEASLQQ